jgi:cation diffusion facilitator family transporter
MAQGIRVTLIGSIVNLLLMVFKLVAGFAANSQALIADGVHSLSDLFSDFVVILGVKIGRKREDPDHHYGHARIETISGMVVGILLVAVGIGIAYSAIATIYGHSVSRPGLFAIWAAVISIVLKEGMYWWTLIVGRRIKSMALIANAWHHRTDAFSSVAVLIGVGAAYINPDWHLTDSIAALVVTFFVLRVGLQLIWSAFRELSDAAPDRVVLTEIARTAKGIVGVRQVHDLRARYSGSQIFVELHIVVDPSISVRHGHAIAKEVKATLLDQFADVTRVIIHVDPELLRDESRVADTD